MALTIGNTGGANVAPLPGAPQGAPTTATKPPVALPESAPPPQQPDPEQLKRAVESMRALVQAKAPNSLRFSIDDETGETIVRVTDAQTGEMIRQIPSEELVEIAKALDKMQGLLLRNKA